MNINYKVPFYSNTADNVHCVQASFKMICEYFVPRTKISFKEWDKITTHKPGLWTWSTSGLMWFKKKGFEVVNIEAFDYNQFSIEGVKYLVNFFGEEVGRSQIEHSDIKQEMIISKDFVKKIKLETRIPKLQEIKTLLKDGFIVVCNINSYALDDEKGYSGHAVVVKGCTDSNLILHDPGLPPRQDLEVSDEKFYKAWAYPNENACNLSAIKLKI